MVRLIGGVCVFAMFGMAAAQAQVPDCKSYYAVHSADLGRVGMDEETFMDTCLRRAPMQFTPMTDPVVTPTVDSMTMPASPSTGESAAAALFHGKRPPVGAIVSPSSLPVPGGAT